MEALHLLSILVFAAALVVLPVHFSRMAMGRRGLVIPLVALPDSVWQLLWAGLLFFCSQTAVLYLRRLVLSRLIKSEWVPLTEWVGDGVSERASE